MKFFRLKKTLGTPIYKNAFNIIINGILVSFFGFLFWIIVSRFYSPFDVGIASVLISSMNLISMFSLLGFSVSLIRFLPNNKENANSIINSCLTINAILSLSLCLIFILGKNLFIPSLSTLTTYIFILILLFTPLISINYLLNSVFISNRVAKYGLFKDTIGNILRLPVLLVILYLGSLGILFSWSLGLIIALILGIFLFLPKVYPDYNFRPKIEKPIIKKMISFSFANYIADIFYAIPNLTLPIILANTISPEFSAYFYISWMIANILFAIPGSMASSLLAEGSHSIANIRVNIKKSIKFISIFLIPSVLIIIIFGDQILSLFGNSYSSNSGLLLKILAISSLLFAFNDIYLSIQKIEKNMKIIIIINFIMGINTIFLSYILLPFYGLVGIGIAWTISQIIILVIFLKDFLKYISKLSIN